MMQEEAVAEHLLAEAIAGHESLKGVPPVHMAQKNPGLLQSQVQGTHTQTHTHLAQKNPV